MLKAMLITAALPLLLIDCTKTKTVYIAVTPTPLEQGDYVEQEGSAATPITATTPTPMNTKALSTSTRVPATATKVPPTVFATVAVTNAEELLFALHNEARQSTGVNLLTYDLELERVAKYRSEDMAEKDYFSHAAPDGKDFGFLLRDFNIPFQTAGENICKIYKQQPEPMAKLAHDLFMNSTGHRENILRAAYSRVGISFAIAENNRVYCTVIFAG